MGKRYIPGPEVRFIQIALAGLPESAGEPGCFNSSEVLYGLTADGRVYYWHASKQFWQGMWMRTEGLVVDDPSVPDTED